MNGSLELNTIPGNAQTAAPSIGKSRRAPVKRGLTQEEVRRELDYDPETGELKWKVWKSGRNLRASAGSSRSDGYRIICVNRKYYKTHRLVWLWWYGYFPENEIDHIDRDKLNNRVSNLREVTPTCNMRNAGISGRNSSGVVGVHWVRQEEKWKATITVSYKINNLGLYKDFTEAVAHRLAVEQCLDWAGCNSNSYAYQYMQNYIKR